MSVRNLIDFFDKIKLKIKFVNEMLISKVLIYFEPITLRYKIIFFCYATKFIAHIMFALLRRYKLTILSYIFFEIYIFSKTILVGT